MCLLALLLALLATTACPQHAQRLTSLPDHLQLNPPPVVLTKGDTYVHFDGHYPPRWPEQVRLPEGVLLCNGGKITTSPPSKTRPHAIQFRADGLLPGTPAQVADELYQCFKLPNAKIESKMPNSINFPPGYKSIYLGCSAKGEQTVYALIVLTESQRSWHGVSSFMFETANVPIEDIVPPK